MTFIIPSDEPDETLLANRSAVVRHRDAHYTLSGIRCGGCGREVVQLDWIASQFLIRAEPGKNKSVRAYECAWCQVVMFEDEMIDGQFVPHFESLPANMVQSPLSDQVVERKSRRIYAKHR